MCKGEGYICYCPEEKIIDKVMKAFITEDDIELGLMEILEKTHHYSIIHCNPSPDAKDTLLDGTGRTDKAQCYLPEVMKESLLAINPGVDASIIDKAIDTLTQPATESTIIDKNYIIYKAIREGLTCTFRKNGKDDFVTVRLIDFNTPSNNTFTAVNQMWIRGHYNWRRPDVLIFINGMPLVFIELKNGNIPVRQAYTKNLKSYLTDVPNLFTMNQICVLSNGLETRLGAFNAGYENFFEWLKNSEEDKIDRDSIRDNALSIKYMADSFLNKETLIDYIENFILFENKHIKIIAKNHQYLGVNNLFGSLQRREELNGKIGVFWHTQGSGKSYSMVMFARKVKRKMQGNFTFLVVTDREDLDGQILKNFIRTEVVGVSDECRPKNSENLRSFLQTNKPFIFSLIHKFGWDRVTKGNYPILSTRNDIIVMVDEAHRTQYNTLGENMRAALPNANFIAFTGTPLLGTKRLTNQWFGNYVSEYNFAQSVEDGATVPLFYSRRVPTVDLANKDLQKDMEALMKGEELNDVEMQKLENSGSRIFEVIKRDDRLEVVAQDIVKHFINRGYKGKGMVVSIDKFTAVTMYDKVQRYWLEEQKNLIKRRNDATEEEKKKIQETLDYMKTVEMAVVISEESDEVEKFQAKGLDITSHRKKMNEITPEGNDIEDRFRDPNDPLQLVFVCAMWLTGFDVPSLSTLYLDKPMKGHTLMQCIARANRCFEGKKCGLIVDYVNVFKWMKEALGSYAISPDNPEMPVKDIESLLAMLEESITMTSDFLAGEGIRIEEAFNEESLDKLDIIRKQYDRIVEKDDVKNKFKVLSSTMINLYEASKPEVFERHWTDTRFAALKYLHDLFDNTVNDEKLERAKEKMGALLNQSVSSNVLCEDKPNYGIKGSKVIDLSKLDVKDLEKELKDAEYKSVEIENLREFIEKTLQQMINRNTTRVSFSERYQGIINRYNAGSTESEDYYEQLLQLIEDLKKENNRAYEEGLTEEELEIYDLLVMGKHLTKAEDQKVKLAAKHLYDTLLTKKAELMVIEWYKDEQTKALVRDTISAELDKDLPDAYDKDSFNSKTNLLLNHFMDMSVQGYGWVA